MAKQVQYVPDSDQIQIQIVGPQKYHRIISIEGYPVSCLLNSKRLQQACRSGKIDHRVQDIHN
jgi:hypothetical protein